MVEYRMRRWSPIILLAALTACTGVRFGKGLKKVIIEDFAEGRVVDCSITEKLTGNREMLFVSMPRKSLFLECYIQGVITDYQDNPISGVVVRGVAVGENAAEESRGPTAGLAGTSFDPGVSDTNGFYRVRFSLPIIEEKVDIRGRILYSPGWEQDKENLGKAYEPQTKQSQFRLYYERRRGRIIFSEGIRKVVVAPIGTGGPGKAAPLPGAKPIVAEKPADIKTDAKAGEEDLFKGFGFGQ